MAYPGRAATHAMRRWCGAPIVVEAKHGSAQEHSRGRRRQFVRQVMRSCGRSRAGAIALLLRLFDDCPLVPCGISDRRSSLVLATPSLAHPRWQYGLCRLHPRLNRQQHRSAESRSRLAWPTESASAVVAPTRLRRSMSADRNRDRCTAYRARPAAATFAHGHPAPDQKRTCPQPRPTQRVRFAARPTSNTLAVKRLAHL